MKATSLSSITLKSECVTTDTDAVANPLSSVLSPLTDRVLAGTVTSKSTSSVFSSTLNC